jgi:type III secretory pathway component EscT
MKNPKAMIRIGMACLLIFSIWPRFLPFTANLKPELIDGVRGVLLGVSIGMNLWAARLACRQRHGD